MTLSALATLTDHGLHVEAQGDKLIVSPASGLNDELRAFIRGHKPDLIQELTRAGDGRWDPDYATKGYVWCLDCRHWNGRTCGHGDNPFRNQQPLAPRKCRWFEIGRQVS